VLWLLGASLGSITAPAGAAPILVPDHVKLETLDNGLRIVLKQEPAQPAVALALYIKAGSLYEPEGKSGLAFLSQRMVFGEQDADGEPGFGRQIQALGGEAMVGTTRDFVQVTVTVAPEYVGDVLQAMGQALAQPDLSAEAFEREQRAVLRRLQAERQQITPRNMQARLSRRLWAEAFRKHPYGGSPRGSEAEIKKLKPADVAGFVKQFYAPDNISLVVVGNTTAQDLVPRVQAALGALEPARSRWSRPPPEPAQSGRRVRVQREATLKATMLSLAFRAPGIENKPDVCAMDLIYTLLGQGDFGWLDRVLRDEKGLAISAEADFLTQREPGLFILTLATPPNKELQARAALEQKIAKLQQELVPEDRLREAKRLLTVNYAFQNETGTDQTGSLGFYDAIDTYEFAIQYIDQVRAVTREDLRRVAQQYFVPERATLVIMRPRGARSGQEAT